MRLCATGGAPTAVRLYSYYMGSHTPDDTTRIVNGLRALVQLLRTGATEAQRRTGLSSAQLFVLAKLADAPAPSVNALARRVHAHQSSASVVIDRLVAKRLVERVPDPDDRRRRHIAITPKGRALLRRAPETVQSRLVAAIAKLPRTTRRTVARGLEDLTGTLGTPLDPAFFLEPDTRDS